MESELKILILLGVGMESELIFSFFARSWSGVGTENFIFAQSWSGVGTENFIFAWSWSGVGV